MESMRDDVVGGYNNFLDEHREGPGRSRITVVQFDSVDSQEVLADAVDVSRAPVLTRDTFTPRGSTPLLDATGKILESIHGRREVRRLLGKIEEEIVLVTVTDGHENQSRRYRLQDVQKLVEAGKAAGWSFVYLGAGMDVYADAARLGYDAGSVQAWKGDGEGARAMWGSVSRAAKTLREDVAAGAAFNKAEYFRGVKEAEEN
jgi:hypothetical protein